MKSLAALALLLASAVAQAQAITVADDVISVEDSFFLGGTPGRVQSNLGGRRQLHLQPAR